MVNHGVLYVFSIELRSETLKENVLLLERNITSQIELIEETKESFKENKTKAALVIEEIAELKPRILHFDKLRHLYYRFCSLQYNVTVYNPSKRIEPKMFEITFIIVIIGNVLSSTCLHLQCSKTDCYQSEPHKFDCKYNFKVFAGYISLYRFILLEIHFELIQLESSRLQNHAFISLYCLLRFLALDRGVKYKAIPLRVNIVL